MEENEDEKEDFKLCVGTVNGNQPFVRMRDDNIRSPDKCAGNKDRGPKGE